MPPFLCVELLEQIIDELRDDRPALRACSLAAPILRVRAQRLLFDGAYVGVDTLYHQHRRPEHVIGLLEARPALAAHVRDLVVDGRVGPNLRVLGHLPFLRSLKLLGLLAVSCAEANNVVEALQAASCRELTKLTLASCHLTTRALSRVVGALPHVREVVMDASSWFATTAPPDDDWPPQLPGLEKLEVSFRAFAYCRLQYLDLSLLAECFSSVRTLEVNMWDHLYYRIPPNNFLSLERILERLAPSLEHLILAGFNGLFNYS
jgi:hypothetical protein